MEKDSNDKLLRIEPAAKQLLGLLNLAAVRHKLKSFVDEDIKYNSTILEVATESIPAFGSSKNAISMNVQGFRFRYISRPPMTALQQSHRSYQLRQEVSHGC